MIINGWKIKKTNIRDYSFILMASKMCKIENKICRISYFGYGNTMKKALTMIFEHKNFNKYNK